MTLQVTEYETAMLALTPIEVLALLPLVRGNTGANDDDARVLQSLTPTRNPGVFEVRPGPYVGRLGLPSGRWIDFSTRFPLEDAFQLIVDAHQLPVRWSDVAVPASPGEFFVDLLASALLHAVQQLVDVGLVKEYRVRRHTRPPYAGRLDPAYHLSHFGGRPDRLATVSNKITHDVEINGIIALALDVLRRVPLTQQVRRRLLGVLPPFAQVSRPPRDLRAITRALRSAPSRYRVAASLAVLAIRTEALVPTGESHTAGSMLFFMPAVWESFVCRWAQRAHPAALVHPGYRFRVASNGATAQADAVVLDAEGRLEALYDAKYKWAVAAPRAPDLYQMVAYCTALGLNEATLVYPVDVGPRSMRVGDITVHVIGVTPRVGDARPGHPGPWRVLQVRPQP